MIIFILLFDYLLMIEWINGGLGGSLRLYAPPFSFGLRGGQVIKDYNSSAQKVFPTIF